MASSQRPHLPVVDDMQVAVGAEMVEIQLGHMCNNRCVFCSSGQATALGQARPMDAEPIFAALDGAKARGARKVTFLGGEPTLQRAFLPALAHAQSLGFSEIEIFTNGVKAARKSWVDEVVALGEFTWRFSIQGGNRKAHDEATAKPGAWDRITRGMDHVRATGQRITANACINELSYRSLPDYPELVQRYDVRQLHLDVVRPQSAGERTDGYLGDVIPRHEDMAPYFAAMLERFDAWDPDYDVNVGNFPFCLLPQWSHKIHHGGQPTVTLASQGDNSLYAKDKYEFQHSDKHHADGCDRCVFRPECTGVFEAYARLHGVEELRPVSLARLRTIDTAQRAFVPLVQPHVAHLLALAPPAPWSLGETFTGARDRIVELTLRHDGAQWRLRLRPAGVDVDGLVRTDRFVIEATVPSQPLDPTTVRELVRWLRARLDSDPELSVTHVAESAEWIAATMEPARLARARATIDAGVERVRAIAGWPDGYGFDRDGDEAEHPGRRVWIRGPQGAVAFGLRVRPEPAPSLVEVTVDADADVPADRVRACAATLRRALSAQR